DRVASPCIGAERADLVLAGCAILEAIRRAFPCPRLRVADRGLREGMLVQMMREDGAWGGNNQAAPSLLCVAKSAGRASSKFASEAAKIAHSRQNFGWSVSSTTRTWRGRNARGCVRAPPIS